MRAFAAGGRPEVRAATKRPVDRRRKKPGPERFFSPHDFEALILTPGLTGPCGCRGSIFGRRVPVGSPAPAPLALRASLRGRPTQSGWTSFQPAEVAQFSTGLDTGLTR